MLDLQTFPNENVKMQLEAASTENYPALSCISPKNLVSPQSFGFVRRMSRKQYVILDKSFLRSVPKESQLEFSARYDFLASATLMEECFQTFLPTQGRDEKTRRLNAGALMKFSDELSRLFHIPSVEFLAGIEARTRRPCWPIEDYVTSRILFNPKYFVNGLRMRNEEEKIVASWTEKVAQNVQITVESYTNGRLWPVYDWDESLRKLAVDPSSPSEELKKHVRFRNQNSD